MKKISLVIFDMDGLMFDTERLALDGWMEAEKKYRYGFTHEFLLSIIGTNVKDCKQIFQTKFGADIPFEEMSKIHNEYAETIIEQQGIPVKEGLYELLCFLEENRISAAVATSSNRKRAEHNLQLAGIQDKFEFLVCGNEVKCGKPAPDIFLAAAARKGCLPSECIVLEDSENGIRGAHAAGMMPVVVPDLKYPSSEVRGLVVKLLPSLLDVKAYLEEEIN